MRELERLIPNFRLRDAWRDKHPNDFGYTCAGRGSYIRMDKAYFSPQFPSAVIRCESLPLPPDARCISDHRALTATPAVVELQPGRSVLWHMDVGLLDEATVVAALRGSRSKTPSPQPFDATQWDGLKAL